MDIRGSEDLFRYNLYYHHMYWSDRQCPRHSSCDPSPINENDYKCFYWQFGVCWFNCDHDMLSAGLKPHADLPDWTLGESMCYFSNFCIHLSLSGSSFALLAISLDRYLAIAHAQKQWMTFKKVNVFLVITWLLSIMLSVPSVLIKPDTSSLTRPADVCLHIWRGSEQTKRFEMIKALLFVLVFSFIAFFYYNIARVLWKRKIPGNQLRRIKKLLKRRERRSSSYSL